MKLVILITLVFLFLIPPITHASTIKINEFYAAGGSSSSNSDWVEIYNEGMDISLYQLIDANNHKKDLSGAICNGHFCTIDWYNLLNKDGDIITLTSKVYPDTPIDQVIYGNFGGISAPGNGQSAGRNPDGTGNWTIFSTSSKGSTNNTSSTSIPIPTPSSTPTPPSSTPTPASSATQPTSSFIISNTPSQISSDQSFAVSISLSLPDNPNTNFYLKGAFKKAGNLNYFGLTKVSGNWVKNSKSYTNQFLVTTNLLGNWSGILESKPDVEDLGFTGNGDYIFKIGRYDPTESNPSVLWSNGLTIRIIVTETESGKTLISTVSPVANSPIPSSNSLKVTTSSQPKSYSVSVYRIASVAAATISSISAKTASPAAQVTIKNQIHINPFIAIGLIFIFTGIGIIGYIYFAKNAKLPF